MNKRTAWKPLTAAFALGWCLLFLHCETTEKSMIRAVYLSQRGENITAVFWYQAPEASADASEASAALQMTGAESNTLEKALFAAQERLPQTADYRLCDYLLIPEDTPDALLSSYEQLLQERQCGRVAARMVCADFNEEELFARIEKDDGFSDKMIGKLKQKSLQMPRLYQREEEMLLPRLVLRETGAEFMSSTLLRTQELRFFLNRETTEMCLLLQNSPGMRTFWLDGKPVRIRRCSVSVTISGEEVLVRLDCQQMAGESTPTETQRKQLEQLGEQTVEQLWKNGVDWLNLRQRRALQGEMSGQMDPTKNAHPKFRTDVRFLWI